MRAVVLVLERHCHSGWREIWTPAQAFCGDPLALALAQVSIASGRHLRVPVIHRVFLYLPLEHSEGLALQNQCVALFEELALVSDHPQFASFTRYAIAHRDVIAQFGRFPHRNAALGRTSSVDEISYLEQHRGF